MESVFLAIAMVIALLLIGAVLLQRSEGGALGMGGGGVMSGRGAATALQKATWGLAVAFIVVCLILTVFATDRARNSGVLDRLDPSAATPPAQPTGEGAGPDLSGGIVAPAPGLTAPSLTEPPGREGAAAGQEGAADGEQPVGGGLEGGGLRAPGLTGD